MIYSFNILAVLQDTVSSVTIVTKLYVSFIYVSSRKCPLNTGDARVTAGIDRNTIP